MGDGEHDSLSILAEAYGVSRDLGAVVAAVVVRTSDQLKIDPLPTGLVDMREIFVHTTTQWQGVGQVVGQLVLNGRSLTRLRNGGRPERDVLKLMRAMVAVNDPPIPADTYVEIVLADIRAALIASDAGG